MDDTCVVQMRTAKVVIRGKNDPVIDIILHTGSIMNPALRREQRRMMCRIFFFLFAYAEHRRRLCQDQQRIAAGIGREKEEVDVRSVQKVKGHASAALALNPFRAFLMPCAENGITGM